MDKVVFVGGEESELLIINTEHWSAFDCMLCF